jgi:hypothetical protein
MVPFCSLKFRPPTAKDRDRARRFIEEPTAGTRSYTTSVDAALRVRGLHRSRCGGGIQPAQLVTLVPPARTVHATRRRTRFSVCRAH